MEGKHVLMSMRGIIACGLVAAASGCASVAPTQPRFQVLFEQRTGLCRTQVIEDSRSSVCVLAFKCGRDDAVFLVVDEAVCVP